MSSQHCASLITKLVGGQIRNAPAGGIEARQTSYLVHASILPKRPVSSRSASGRGSELLIPHVSTSTRCSVHLLFRAFGRCARRNIVNFRFYQRACTPPLVSVLRFCGRLGRPWAAASLRGDSHRGAFAHRLTRFGLSNFVELASRLIAVGVTTAALLSRHKLQRYCRHESLSRSPVTVRHASMLIYERTPMGVGDYDPLLGTRLIERCLVWIVGSHNLSILSPCRRDDPLRALHVLGATLPRVEQLGQVVC